MNQAFKAVRAGKKASGEAGWSATGARSGCDSLLRVMIQAYDNAERGESIGCFKHQTSARHLNTKNVTSVVDGGLRSTGDY